MSGLARGGGLPGQTKRKRKDYYNFGDDQSDEETEFTEIEMAEMVLDLQNNISIRDKDETTKDEVIADFMYEKQINDRQAQQLQDAVSSHTKYHPDGHKVKQLGKRWK